MTEHRRVFHLGLNMAGAVSAGAYTAGVIDFLIDALDTLYKERAEQRKKYGDDYSRWEIPAHEVRLAVMSGASAGGMTAAIAAAALCEDFKPVRSPMPTGATNRLYRAWVEDIDITSLLSSQDLADETSPVLSLLNSTPIDEIAANAVKVTEPLPAKRPYVADALKLILTLTNLGGIPYALESGSGNVETQTLYHADQANFELRWDGLPSETQGLTLAPDSPANWPELAEAAKATGAFPIALTPRKLNRTTTMYNERLWHYSNAEPGLPGEPCHCEVAGKMEPNWEYADGVSFQTVNIDGGVTNNNPFECARQVLLAQQPSPTANHNPRSGQMADRAVISIAPFLSSPSYDLHQPPSSNLLSVLGQLVSVLVNQSRIQGENLKLTQDPGVYSRWAISPSVEDTARNALASASLGAFGGFISKKFRDHDYQLGRRNCQQFLKTHFGVPFGNIVLQDYPLSPAAKETFSMKLADGSEGICLIPLLPPLTGEITEFSAKIPANSLPPLISAANERLKLISSRLLFNQHNSLWKNLAFRVAWSALEGSLQHSLLNRVGYELARQNLIE